MDDTFRVRGVEGVRKLNREVQNFVGLEGPRADAVLEGLAFQQFHGDERLSIVLANFVNRADVGMVQRRRGTGLALEAFKACRITLA